MVGQLASLQTSLTELTIAKQETNERIRQVRPASLSKMRPYLVHHYRG